MQQDYPLTRELVLIGGGHTHALVLRKWGMAPQPGVRVTVVNPGPTAPYTGMLPGYVAGHYSRDDLDIDLVRLARFAGARLVVGSATGIDLSSRRIEIDGGARWLGYDTASIDIGITSDMPDIPGFAEHGVAAKPLDWFASAWATYLEGTTPARIAVVGGGVAGVELAMAMAHACDMRGRAKHVTIVEQGRALEGLPDAAARRLRSALKEHAIDLLENASVTQLRDDGLCLSGGRTVASDFTVGAAGARPHPWLTETGLVLKGGYVRVTADMRTSDPNVFAAGDCAYLSHAPRPKAGVFAVRAAPVLYHNLRAHLSGRPKKVFRPQKSFLKLISLGEKSALAEKAGAAVSGPMVWRWKDWIDQRFMEKFRDLPAMKRAPVPRDAAKGVADIMLDKPLCAGCGSKVGAGILGEAIAALPQPTRPDVISQIGDDAGILRMGDVYQVQTTDHLRAFTEDPALFARIAVIHALGDIWAMGAEPQAAIVNIILPRMSSKLQSLWLDEIMSAAADVLSGENTPLIGGHTTLGAELTLGFTLTGLTDRPPITIGGARPRDVLVLTRPIGSGTLLAGEMAMQAKGEWVVGALAEMAQAQSTAAKLLRNANAMTDVTGFGLAGHLLNICSASGVAADLDLNAVPFYPGAIELAEQGVRSSLFAQNRLSAGAVAVPQTAAADLLFDPQTAGGLLAALPADQADGILADLHAAGVPAVRIGEMKEGPARVSVGWEKPT